MKRTPYAAFMSARSAGSAATDGTATPVSRAISELAGTLVAADSEAAVLERIARLALAVVPGSDAAGCAVLDAGRTTVAGYTAAEVETTQHQWEQQQQPGPHAAAFHGQSEVVVDDLAAQSDGSFTPAGPYRSVLAAPLALGESVVAVVAVYAAKPQAFAGLDLTELSPFLQQAAVAVRNVRDYTAAATLSEQLQDALTSRAVIEQAKGAIMASRRVGADEAFELLRRSSQRRNLKLRDVAQEVVDSTRPPAVQRPHQA